MSEEEMLIPEEAVSWWSWRPGIKPGLAFALGGLLSLLAIFLLLNGALTLTAGALDSTSAPVRVAGVVTGHAKDLLGTPQLMVLLEQPGTATTITLTVSTTTSAALSQGSHVFVDYAPHRHIAYALESQGRRYELPGASAESNLWSTAGLLLSGLLLLPYPLLLSFWGWRDLHAGRDDRRSGTVVAKRQARQTTTRTPGLVPRTSHVWHGLALQIDQSAGGSPTILRFGVTPEQHAQFQVGARVEVICSPHLHHLYALKRLP